MTVWRKNNFPNIVCPGNISYNCKYILPGRPMKDQPIIGKPLGIKYIRENGSSGSKRMKQSAILKGAVNGYIKESIKFINIPIGCGKSEKCGYRPICNLNSRYNPNL